MNLKSFFIDFFQNKQKQGKLSIILIGFLSTIWFLFRVIPKPGRAAYPCVRAAAPFMTGFLIWLAGTGISLMFFKKSFRLFKQSKYTTASLLLVPAVLAGVITLFNTNSAASAEALIAGDEVHPANDPYGEALELYPGRVVWIWNPDATNENSKMVVNENGLIDKNDDVFYVPKNNDPEVIENMVAWSIRQLTGKTDYAAAWDELFRFHNKRKNNLDKGYSEGQTIFIKTNNQGIGLTHTFTSTLGQKDATIWGSYPPHMTATSPYPIVATLKQLIEYAKVPEEMIYIGDPHINFNNIYYDIIRESFPNVNIMGVNGGSVKDCEAYGRTLSVKSNESCVFYSDKGTVLEQSEDKLYKQLEDADYVINIPALKPHIRAGITLFTKSHFGSHTRDAASHLHPGLVAEEGGNAGYGKYRVLTDIMGHECLGGNTMLYILDALWGGKPHELREPRKYDMAPFNGDYTSSIFASIDPVAIASVAYDFLRTEYDKTSWGKDAVPNIEGVDDYLHQAADPALWAEGIIYDPENDGTPLTSLGVHEHWNNSVDKQYSRNLNPETGKGIELLAFTKEDMASMGIKNKKIIHSVRSFPNPCVDELNIQIKDANTTSMEIAIYSSNGRKMMSEIIENADKDFYYTLNTSELKSGSYFLSIQSGSNLYSGSFIKR